MRLVPQRLPHEREVGGEVALKPPDGAFSPGSAADSAVMMKPPGRQTNYEDARVLALAKVRSAAPETLEILGAVRPEPGICRLHVLDEEVRIDLTRGEVVYATGAGFRPCAQSSATARVPIEWQILILHYLGADSPGKESSGWLSFSEVAEARGYLPVFNQRVIGRLTGTAGRNRETFRSSCGRAGGARFDWGDEGYRFKVFPLLEVGIAWFEGDEDLPPGASFVYSNNVRSLLPVEDMVVVAEKMVSRLQAESRGKES